MAYTVPMCMVSALAEAHQRCRKSQAAKALCSCIGKELPSSDITSTMMHHPAMLTFVLSLFALTAQDDWKTLRLFKGCETSDFVGSQEHGAYDHEFSSSENRNTLSPVAQESLVDTDDN